MTTFADLGLSPEILDALTKKGFESPSPIQAQAIPHILTQSEDLIGQAQTGTGKTAAFGIPVLDQITEDGDHVQALIITPTRELTLQVTKELNELKGSKRIKITSIYGGQSIALQKQQLKRASGIVVGTPGRLMDHMRGKRLDVSSVDFLVLDEADEMMTSGFLEDMTWILERSNPDRRTLLFSATMPTDIAKLAKTYMNNPVTIAVKKSETKQALTEQSFIECRDSDKLEVVCRLMDSVYDFYGLVFCRTKRDVDLVTQRLIQRGYEAEAMHGDLSQIQRERVLDKFRRRNCTILVVTDVASRGLDISGLTHVINYAIPQDAETYVHRVGRTGRAGKKGTAITLIVPSEFGKLMGIKKHSNQQIHKQEAPTVANVVASKTQRLEAKIHDVLGKKMAKATQDLAKKLLSSYSPEEAIEAVIAVAFEKELSEDHYQEIKTPKRPAPKRGGYQNQKGQGYRGGNSKNRRFSKKG